MGYFAGYLEADSGTTKISPTSPARAVHLNRSTESGFPATSSWKSSPVTHGPLGDVHRVRMMEYNAANSVYTYNEYNSLGEHVVAVGKIEGQKWIWRPPRS